MSQIDMFASLPGPPPSPSPRSIEERFAAFDKAHPEVFQVLVALATVDIASGQTRIGVKSLWERLRGRLATAGDGGYSLNNSFTASFARKLAAHDPRFAAAIELRERRAK